MLASCVHFFGVIFYAIFASGEKQPWAEAEGETPLAWNPPKEVPEDVAKSDYGYGAHEDNDVGGKGDGIQSRVLPVDEHTADASYHQNY